MQKVGLVLGPESRMARFRAWTFASSMVTNETPVCVWVGGSAATRARTEVAICSQPNFFTTLVTA